jgi:hypothetical protein
MTGVYSVFSYLVTQVRIKLSAFSQKHFLSHSYKWKQTYIFRIFRVK